MEYLSTNKIAIVDLATSKVTDQEVDEDLVKERIGGAGITTALYEQYQDEDPIVLGTGLLTGTLAPASALGMITAKSPLTGKVCHAPLTLYAGLELRYSGFDYVVIKESPRNLFIYGFTMAWRILTMPKTFGEKMFGPPRIRYES